MNIEKKKNLIEQICKAFKNVTLEGGIGLHEAKAFDEYAGMQARMLYRQKDEINDGRLYRLRSGNSTLIILPFSTLKDGASIYPHFSLLSYKVNP